MNKKDTCDIRKWAGGAGVFYKAREGSKLDYSPVFQNAGVLTKYLPKTDASGSVEDYEISRHLDSTSSSIILTPRGWDNDIGRVCKQLRFKLFRISSTQECYLSAYPNLRVDPEYPDTVVFRVDDQNNFILTRWDITYVEATRALESHMLGELYFEKSDVNGIPLDSGALFKTSWLWRN
ncbi:hypothetical protein NBRC116583_02860 [Arenicella sp. 4NH20-0111]|uniref:hypothetical protein n=1 Tax=Arenicella sp. 4NH20-0111 TaxID=3127648 RepID=UPI0031090DDA